MKITFHEIAPKGFAVDLDGQGYTSTGYVAHQKQDGSVVAMNGWKSHCADCRQPIDCMTVPGRPFWPARRCAEHAKPGVRVNPKKKQFGTPSQ